MLPLISQSLGNQHWIRILLLLKFSIIDDDGSGNDGDGDDDNDDLTFIEHLLSTRLCAKCFMWIIVYDPHSPSVRQV